MIDNGRESCQHCGRPLLTKASRADHYHSRCLLRVEAGIAEIAKHYSAAQLAKAANAISTGRIDYRPGGVSKIKGSGSNVYRTTSTGCSCAAHIPCWHMATVQVKDLSPGPVEPIEPVERPSVAVLFAALDVDVTET
jgi:hypothetical protein